MRRTRNTGITALAGLMLAAAAAASPAQAANGTTGTETAREAVVYSATFVGKIPGTRGNVHDVSIENDGDMNYVQSWYCPSTITSDTKEGCVQRADRRISPRSPADIRVSATGMSATITGTVKAKTMAGYSARTFDVDLTLRASGPVTDGRRELTFAYGTFAGLDDGLMLDGFLVR